MRGEFGDFARAFSRVLTQAQRDAWNVAGPKVQSKTRLGSGPLTGQQLFQSLNSARACIRRGGLLLLPTAQVIFDPSPVGRLTATNGEEGVRLLLKVSGPVTEDIMVFGQAPCSAGRSKRRNVAYLGLPSAPQDGMIDITDIYVARYGEPRPGEKIFIVTRQQKDGWEGDDLETSDIVPEKPAGQQAASTVALTLLPHMHKGCTRDAQGSGSQAAPEEQASGKPGIGSREATRTQGCIELPGPRAVPARNTPEDAGATGKLDHPAAVGGAARVKLLPVTVWRKNGAPSAVEQCAPNTMRSRCELVPPRWPAKSKFTLAYA
jgi:hypothetical protein